MRKLPKLAASLFLLAMMHVFFAMLGYGYSPVAAADPSISFRNSEICPIETAQLIITNPNYNGSGTWTAIFYNAISNKYETVTSSSTSVYVDIAPSTTSVDKEFVFKLASINGIPYSSSASLRVVTSISALDVVVSVDKLDPFKVTYKATPTLHCSGVACEYLWTFANGATASGSSPTNIYQADAVNFNAYVQLIATKGGLYAVAEKTIVKEASSRQQEFYSSLRSSTLCTAENNRLTVVNTKVSDGDRWTIEYKVINSAMPQEETKSVTSSKRVCEIDLGSFDPGVYTIRVVRINNENATLQGHDMIIVPAVEKPKIEVSTIEDSPALLFAASIKAHQIGGSPCAGKIDFEWEFGDGYSDLGAESEHVFKKTGTCTVVLKAIDSKGNSVSSTQRITAFANGEYSTFFEAPLLLDEHGDFVLDPKLVKAISTGLPVQLAGAPNVPILVPGDLTTISYINFLLMASSIILFCSYFARIYKRRRIQASGGNDNWVPQGVCATLSALVFSGSFQVSGKLNIVGFDNMTAIFALILACEIIFCCMPTIRRHNRVKQLQRSNNMARDEGFTARLTSNMRLVASDDPEQIFEPVQKPVPSPRKATILSKPGNNKDNSKLLKLFK
ncbi:MAG: PKD domain-containing protein [Eubacteriaceae bacterium]|nr:PKD domain-containing protein [Eubacteriaceae bacterium]